MSAIVVVMEGGGDRPGASAQQEYERLRAREREERRAHRIRTIALLLVLPGGMAGGVLLGCAALNDALATTSEPVPISAGIARLIAALVFVAMFTIVAAESWSSSEEADALRRDADAERSTAAVLERLGRQGWMALHDRRFVRSARNVDHVAVGPTGVAVIESRQWTGRVVVTRRRIRHNGKRVEGLVGQVQDEIAAIQLLLGDAVPVFGVVCVHGARVEHRRGLLGVIRRQRPTPGGVEISGRRRLRRAICDRPVVEGLDVEAVIRKLDEALRPAG
jgi:hypothetical protein